MIMLALVQRWIESPLAYAVGSRIGIPALIGWLIGVAITKALGM